MRRRWIWGFAILGVVGAVTLLLARPAPALQIVGYFVDDNGNLFEEDIDAIADVGITKGCNPPANTNFCPNTSVDRGAMAAFLRRALDLPTTTTDYFIDDETSVFEADINAIAAAGITKGCNPPTNNRYCPASTVTRGQMAAFLKRAFGLPLSQTDYFIDDETSIFEADINAIAAAGITKGCNPPSNNRYCPDSTVKRGAMAAFLRRALDLPSIVLELPLADHSAITCAKDGVTCSLYVQAVAGRTYRIEEGIFLALPASSQDESDFAESGTFFSLTVDGSPASIDYLGLTSDSDFSFRNWRDVIVFSPGSHTITGTWYWHGDLMLRTTVTVSATG